MKKTVLFRISVVLAVIASIFTVNMSAFARECRAVRESTLRLHIIANSDSDEDQALKLKIRDRILSETGYLFSAAGSKDSAIESAKEHMDFIISIARDEVIKNGYDYEVSAEITEMFFETKVYGDTRMPAGRYNALRITVGEAAGKNWWCVLFPPLCLPECTKTGSDYSELQPVSGENAEYEVKFYIVELYERIKEWICD